MKPNGYVSLQARQGCPRDPTLDPLAYGLQRDILVRAMTSARESHDGSIGLICGLCFAVLVTSCGNFKESVRTRAASDFECPADRVALSPTRPLVQPQAYLASGCGKSQAYEGGCDAQGCLVEPTAESSSRVDVATSGESRSTSSERTFGQPVASNHRPAPVGPAALATVSVSLRSECSRTVKVFFGKDPKFGSGTLSTIGGNSAQSMSFREGDLIWLVDDSRNALGSVSVSAASRRVKILKSCTGFAPD